MTGLHPEDLARRMRPALTRLYVMYFRVAEQSDLTGPQLSILSRLAEHGPSRISQIARQEGIRMPTASNALHQLEQRGMVERVRDTADRRGVRVQITDHGAAEFRRVGEERNRYFADLLSALEERDLDIADQAVGVINRLAQNYARQLDATEE